MTQTVVLGPLYDPVVKNHRMYFTTKDCGSCGKIIELDPDSVYRIWTIDDKYYVEYEVDGELGSTLKRLVVDEPPPGARLYIDCTIDDVYKNEFEFEDEKCQFVSKDEYGHEVRFMLISTEEYCARRVLQYLKSEFGVECPKGVILKWVGKVVMSPGKDFDWLARYIVKHVGDYNSNNKEKSCWWLATMAWLLLWSHDLAKYEPKSAKDLRNKLVFCKVKERVELFKTTRDPSVFKGLDKELRLENLMTTV
jgi:hypothetical protein